jgi:hypothetical protein
MNIQQGYETNVVGQMLLQWGIERADSLGIEFWTISDTCNADLYQANSLEVVSPAVASSMFWSMRRRAVNNRERYKSSYLDTEGFW